MFHFTCPAGFLTYTENHIIYLQPLNNLAFP